ncbi:hypothetical protein ANCDUO_13329 [Ancylostoma duodenale]|uniref:ATP-grasp domain-containing protein n=1 Tax=Ancylostoma duodenale TaxID=51022 RepID=A0A0C2G687_9BILA|nr:hypothetical protein ANCDUO_13329 [Ancylostoma duodenale]
MMSLLVFSHTINYARNDSELHKGRSDVKPRRPSPRYPAETHTIIIVLWKYRLNLSKLRKPGNVRIFVVGPPRTLVDENNVDVYFQVESPIRDHDHLQLLQKVRELCSMYAASQRRLVAFERSLQKAVARIRKELSIEGFYPEQLEQILSVRDAIHNPRKNGLATLRQCSLSGSPQPEPWLEVVRSQVGGFPVVVRSIRQHPPQGILRTEREFRQWFRRNSTVHHCEEYVVQEFIDDGYEFTALCTAKLGLIACTASVETHRTILECIQNQLPYAVQLFSVEQTRDLLPGVESFATQVVKATFSKSYSGAIFIKGFYKDHNDIFFLGFSLEPESETVRTLLAMSRSMPWEIALIESHYEINDSMQNGHSASLPVHNCVVNFPTAEGVLIHQTSIPKRPTSEMRVAWRCAEGQEMTDSTSIDENVAQVYLTNPDHDRLIEEAQDIMRNTDITIDRNVLLDRHSVCRRNVSRLNPRELIRSCTTTD